MSNPVDSRLWTALITPLTNEGAVDTRALTRLLRIQEAAGCGVVLLGSTGEGANLTRADRESVLRHACDLELSIPLMAGVGGIQLEETHEWLDFCEDLPLDAYLMVTPLYAKPGTEGQRRWFQSLMDRISKPCMLYNVPSRTGCRLSLPALEALVGHPRFWAVKEAGGDLLGFGEYVHRLPGIQIFSGDDAYLPEQAKLGAAGLISVMSNAWPHATRDYVRAALAGASLDLSVWRKVAGALFVAANPIPIKALLHLRGWIESAEVRLPLHRTDLDSLDPLLEADRLIARLEEAVA